MVNFVPTNIVAGVAIRAAETGAISRDDALVAFRDAASSTSAARAANEREFIKARSKMFSGWRRLREEGFHVEYNSRLNCMSGLERMYGLKCKDIVMSALARTYWEITGEHLDYPPPTGEH